jgi:hypothetical protein
MRTTPDQVEATSHPDELAEHLTDSVVDLVGCVGSFAESVSPS